MMINRFKQQHRRDFVKNLWDCQRSHLLTCGLPFRDGNGPPRQINQPRPSSSPAMSRSIAVIPSKQSGSLANTRKWPAVRFEGPAARPLSHRLISLRTAPSSTAEGWHRHRSREAPGCNDSRCARALSVRSGNGERLSTSTAAPTYPSSTFPAARRRQLSVVSSSLSFGLPSAISGLPRHFDAVMTAQRKTMAREVMTEVRQKAGLGARGGDKGCEVRPLSSPRRVREGTRRGLWPSRREMRWAVA